jgi:hypothetical protein
MQMWELMGRLMLDDNLLSQLEPLERDDEAVHGALNGTGGGYHLSRAEICEISGLLSQRAFVNRMRALGTALSNALEELIPGVNHATDANLRGLREVIGLLCIDTAIRNQVRAAATPEDVRTALAGHNFPLSLEHAGIVHRVLGPTGTGFQHVDVIHACWSPPDCLSGVTFSPNFRRPRFGGTIRETAVRDQPHGSAQ